MSATPISITVSSKKRELTSPDVCTDIKKNRVSGSQSEAETDISDLSLSENMDNMDTATEKSADVTDEISTQVILSDSHLEKMAALMQQSFQPQVAQVIQDSFKEQIADLVSSIVEGVLQGLQSKVSSLEKENAELKKRVGSLETALDNAEQYSRRNCLKITGVPETTEGSTDDYVCNLARAIDVDLSIDDIDRSHRLGKPRTAPDQKPRDIIVKFVSYRKRSLFYKARILTKSRGYRGVYINEHLTRTRSTLLYEARRRVKSKQLKSAWSTDGVVMVKLNDANPDINFDGTVLRIFSECDLPAYVPLSNQ
ncbi:MAG: hypothetical protein AB2693_31320 [Candidatus Thiodiazotropha sp.]